MTGSHTLPYEDGTITQKWNFTFANTVVVKITSITPDTIAPTNNDGTYFSIPRSGQVNRHQRWFTVRYKVLRGSQNITAQSHFERVRLDLDSASGETLQEKLVDSGLGEAVKEKEEEPGELSVRVTFASDPSAVNSTPPPANLIVYRFTVTVEDEQNQSATSPPKDSDAMHALWQMPDGFPRYGPCGQAEHDAEGPGGDDWVSQHTYEWMDANRALLTAINDATFEHGLNLGPHVSHATGNDLDLFHIYPLAGASTCSGTAYYDTLVTTVRRAFGQNHPTGQQIADARQQITNWIDATRARFDQLLPMNRVRLIIYARGATIPGVLAAGWAEQLLREGQCTDLHGHVLSLTGAWGNQANTKMRYQTDHDNHVHLSLNP